MVSLTIELEEVLLPKSQKMVLSIPEYKHSLMYKVTSMPV